MCPCAYLEFGTVDRFAAGAVKPSEIAALDHELRDDAVEDGPLVVQGLAALAGALLASAQRAEVVRGLGDLVAVQAHDDAPCSAQSVQRHVSGGQAIRYPLCQLGQALEQDTDQ